MKGRRTPQTVKLDGYAKIVFSTILQHQDYNTGLMSDNENGHAWIRDNVYSILSVWALSMAYKKHRSILTRIHSSFFIHYFKPLKVC